VSSHSGFTQESLKLNITQVLRDEWTDALKLIEVRFLVQRATPASLFAEYLLDMWGLEIIVTWLNNRYNFLIIDRLQYKDLESSDQIISCARNR
jgi:hypothetical protein